MSKPIILLGDKTDHGGVVIEGAPSSDIMGKRIARVGDKVTCSKNGCPSETVIATGDPTCLIDGKPVARHGDKTACGATLIASQSTTTDDPEGAGSGSTSSTTQSSSAKSSPSPSDAASKEDDYKHFAYDEMAVLAASNPAVQTVGLPWFIQTNDGQTFSGRLDESGKLPRVGTSAAEAYEILWGDEALAKMQGLA